jgi:hypothetical protein
VSHPQLLHRRELVQRELLFASTDMRRDKGNRRGGPLRGLRRLGCRLA